MALPKILPYAMPTVIELPKNKVSWSPNADRAALLIHDMQRYFIGAFTPDQSPLVELVKNISIIRDMCARLGIPVIYTAQPADQSNEERGLLKDFWGKGIADQTQKEIIPELEPRENDSYLTKWRYSGFEKTNLRDLLKHKGRDQLIICGVYAHIGCLLTACDAYMQDVQPFFVADAVADFSQEQHIMALNYASELCAYTLLTEDLTRILEA